MTTFLLFITLSFITFSLLFGTTEQVKPTPIVDSKTGKELQLLTQTYYAIQNQKSKRYLIWFGKNGTVDSEPEETDSKYWHIFEKVEGGWYKMKHHFGSHNVKIAKSHQEGYYHIYNKDCFNGEHPNGDGDDRGTIKCFVVEKGDLLQFNWEFFKKMKQPDETESARKKHDLEKKYMIMVFGGMLIVVTLITVLRHLSYHTQNNSPQVVYEQDNDGFIDTPVFPTQRNEKI